MQGVPKQFEVKTDRAEFQQGKRKGVELYRAHIVQHAFEPHLHEEYGLGIVEQGVEKFRCNGATHLAPTHAIVLMNPEVLHTGQAETKAGWFYRMIYIHPALLHDLMGDKWLFKQHVIDQAPLCSAHLSHLLMAMWHATDSLTFDGLLYQLLITIKPYATLSQSAQEPFYGFKDVLAYMDATLHERILLEDLAAVAHLSPFHFLRQFSRQYDVTPHQMLLAKRLHVAKQMLSKGIPPTDVACAVGLTDQSHLNRTFVRRYGVTPGRYQSQVS